jgi:peptide/nickel transport system ATP-binding protein
MPMSWRRSRSAQARAGTTDESALAPGDQYGKVVEVKDLVVEYAAGRGQRVKAVSGISFEVAKGQTLGLVGESGCGKSSVGQAIMCLPRPTSGSVVFEGTDLTRLAATDLRRQRRRFQMVFQDPISSLNPRRTVADIIAEPLVINREGTDTSARSRRVEELMEAVGLAHETSSRRAHELSGGQCQRVSIARALMLDPTLLICDEPVSALDVSVQAQILNLLEDMKIRYGLTMIFISHDLAVVKNVSDQLAVMYLGKLCEVGPPDAVYQGPRHPYTVMLIDSIPLPVPHTPRRAPASSQELPSSLHPPSGCRFRTRCPRADRRCVVEEPRLRAIGPAHLVACHHPLEPPGDAATALVGELSPRD